MFPGNKIGRVGRLTTKDAKRLEREGVGHERREKHPNSKRPTSREISRSNH
jgi:hypothetical protein